MLQVYTDKTACNTTTSAYPIKIGLLNADYHQRIKHIGTIGFIPVLKPRAGFSDQAMATVRRTVVDRCLDIILEPLKQASHVGTILRAPDSCLYRVFPRLLSYVADDPEQRLVAHIYGSCSCQRQCCRCYCPTDQLSELNTAFELRTIERQAEIRAHGQDICTQFSTHPGASALEGFAGQDNLCCKWSACIENYSVCMHIAAWKDVVCFACTQCVAWWCKKPADCIGDAWKVASSDGVNNPAALTPNRAFPHHFCRRPLPNILL